MQFYSLKCAVGNLANGKGRKGGRDVDGRGEGWKGRGGGREWKGKGREGKGACAVLTFPLKIPAIDR